MSDVPELDRLIEEAENLRTNMKWRKRDRFFKLTLFFFSLLIPVSFLFMLFFPSYAAAPIIALFIVILFSLAFAFFDMVSLLLKDDWEGVDMTKRYNRK